LREGCLQPVLSITGRPLYLDLSPVGTSQDAVLARLLAAGARPADVGQRGDEGWHVLADPEGNEFCLPRRQLATRLRVGRASSGCIA
jgi:hypothetical protein